MIKVLAFCLVAFMGMLPPIKSVKIGLWRDKSTWNLNRLPTAADTVEIEHDSVTNDSVASAKKVIIKTGAKLHVTAGSSQNFF